MTRPSHLHEGCYNNPGLQDKLNDVIEYLETEPRNDLVIPISNDPANPDGFDTYMLIDMLAEICDKLKKNRDDIKDLDDRVKDLEQA